jgi:radical SAM superfamily enzyme YgiQ (UPF0313 family)
MNIILVSGIYDLVPARSVGPYLLRHYIQKRGHTCQVIDHCQEFNADKLYTMITKFIDSTTVCIGLSSTFWRDPEKRTWDNSKGMPPNLHEATVRIKKDFPHVKLIIGGAGLRNVNDSVEHIDHIVVGEGEDLLPELVSFWKGEGPEPFRLYNFSTKKYYYNRPINKTHDISKCDFEWTDSDCIVEGESLPLETARGCIFKCKFCSYPHLGKKKFDYLKPADTIRNHLIRNYEKWGITHYTMLDDTFNDSEFKINEFLEMTKTLPFKLTYSCYIRADLVHSFDGMAEKLLESGLRGAFFGIESLNEKSAKVVGKGWSAKHAREYVPHLLKNIWQNKVTVTIGFIAGLPGDTEENLLDTLKWVNDNNLHAYWLGLGVANPKTLAKRGLGEVLFTSEFEKESDKYGYQFDKRGLWYNGEWNHDRAINIAEKTLNPRRKNRQFSSWLRIQLPGFGYTESELDWLAEYGIIHNQIIKSEVFAKRKLNFINQYEQKILNLVL